MISTILLQRTALYLLIFSLAFATLYFAKPFLVPLTFAIVLSMLFYPLSKWLETKGINRGISSFICVVAFVSVIGAVVVLLVWQLAGMAPEMAGIEENISRITEKIQMSIESSFGINKEKQQQLLQKQQQSSGSTISIFVKGFLNRLGGFLVDSILTLVYIFLLLFLRRHLKLAILRFVSQQNHSVASKILNDASTVSRKYITGLAMMIVILWVMYGIGFSIIGVKHAIFFAILCGLLEIVPFIGNLTGTALTILATISQTGSSGMVIGILVTYFIIQFVQSYLLEPLIVGSAENINPLFTIISLLVGELVWGIPGMVLALPVVGIIKVVCDNIEPLMPYGFLIGKQKKDDTVNMGDKLKKLVSRL